MRPFDAIVLAGGGGERLGGVDKAMLDIDGKMMIDTALAAVARANAIVVVGPDRAVPYGYGRGRARIVTAQERPAGSGPVAAIAEGIEHVDSAVVVVLACDMPFLTQRVVTRLTDALWTTDAIMLVDESGRRQFLAAAYSRNSLTAALQRLGDPTGRSMRDLVAGLTVTEVPAEPGVTLDIDSWDDVERSREWLKRR